MAGNARTLGPKHRLGGHGESHGRNRCRALPLDRGISVAVFPIDRSGAVARRSRYSDAGENYMNATSNPATAVPIEHFAAGESLGAVDHRHHLHGLRGQSAVRLDAVRQSHRCQVSLGTRSHPGGLHRVRADRDLAGAGRRLSGRPLRAALGGASAAAFWSASPGCINSIAEFACRCCTSPPRSAASARAACTAPASATRSSGFPGRRGIAAGLTAAGFGAGAALTIMPISHMIASAGYQHAFLVFGLCKAASCSCMAWLLLVPPPHDPERRGRSRARPRTATRPREVLRSPCSTCCTSCSC